MIRLKNSVLLRKVGLEDLAPDAVAFGARMDAVDEDVVRDVAVLIGRREERIPELARPDDRRAVRELPDEVVVLAGERPERTRRVAARQQREEDDLRLRMLRLQNVEDPLAALRNLLEIGVRRGFADVVVADQEGSEGVE